MTLYVTITKHGTMIVCREKMIPIDVKIKGQGELLVLDYLLYATLPILINKFGIFWLLKESRCVNKQVMVMLLVSRLLNVHLISFAA